MRISDWSSDVCSSDLRTAYTSSQDLTISGGTDRSNFLLSLGQLTNNGIVMNTSYNRYNVRVNSQHSLFKNFTLGDNFMVDINDRRSAAKRGDSAGVIYSK